MQTRRKCPSCKSHTISLLEVAQMMVGMEKVSCSKCNQEVELSQQAKNNRHLFWLIEIIMYSVLIYFSFAYKSWTVFTWGLCVTTLIEIIMLYLKPLVSSKSDSFIEKEI